MQQYYPETIGEVVNITAIEGVTGTNVQQALESIQGNINDITGGGTVTNVNGVKGAVNIAEGTNIGVTVSGQNITISTPAEENVIDEVQLNGTKITPTGKKVNVQVTKATEATKATNVNLKATVTTDTTNGDKVSIGAGTGTKAEFNVVNAKKSATSDKLATARKITVNVNSGKKADNSTNISGSGNATFDGSADKSINVELGASGVTAGAYSAVQVNAKGIVTGGGSIVEFDTGTGQPSTNLAVGGLFFKIIS